MQVYDIEDKSDHYVILLLTLVGKDCTKCGHSLTSSLQNLLMHLLPCAPGK